MDAAIIAEKGKMSMYVDFKKAQKAAETIGKIEKINVYEHNGKNNITIEGVTANGGKFYINIEQEAKNV